jgi:hypothetical protein
MAYPLPMRPLAVRQAVRAFRHRNATALLTLILFIPFMTDVVIEDPVGND